MIVGKYPQKHPAAGACMDSRYHRYQCIYYTSHQVCAPTHGIIDIDVVSLNMPLNIVRPFGFDFRLSPPVLHRDGLSWFRTRVGSVSIMKVRLCADYVR